MLKIGNLSLSKRFILAPLAGISSLPYRQLNRAFGAELAFTEMACVRSLAYLSRKTQDILRSDVSDRPLGVQILGRDAEWILKGLDRLKDHNFDLLDFNAACPKKKVTAKGKGAYLLRQPRELRDILKLVAKNFHLPLTLKMRLGWDSAAKSRDIALYAQDAGIAALCVHGRTRNQGYGGEVDYPAIAAIKRSLTVPVIGSGNVFSAKDAARMFTETGVDAVAVARGGLGNPWIFRELSGSGVLPPARTEVAKVMVRHLDLLISFYGRKAGLVEFRKFFIWYTRGFSAAKQLRAAAARVTEKRDMLELIRRFER